MAGDGTSDPTHLDDLRNEFRDRPGDRTPDPAPAPQRKPGQAAPLAPLEFLRYCWRQLTSMRTALFLLLLLAVAAVPGSTFPQENNDPTRVAAYLQDHPDLGPWLERLQVFHVYSSVWFSAIYLLLFISLVGCVLPRARVHLAGMRARPPRTPARLDRLPEHGRTEIAAPAEEILIAARNVLRSKRFVVERHDPAAGDAGSVAAEKGRHRETGNLLFHLSLIGILAAVAAGSVFSYSGQRLVTVGSTMIGTNLDTFSGGAFAAADQVPPFTLSLEQMNVAFEAQQVSQIGQPRQFSADVRIIDEPGDGSRAETIAVNHPAMIGSTQISLSGNGYAPVIVVRDGQGDVVSDAPVPFLPQSSNYDSSGVLKVPDAVDANGDPVQIGLRGVFLPTASVNTENLPVSAFPDLANPLLAMNVYTGDLGLDDGAAQNVYELDTSGLTEVRDADGQPVAVQLTPGQSVTLPDGLGSITFEGVERFASFDVRYTPGQTVALISALLAATGLILSLFLPRRRVWVRVRPGASGTQLVEVGGLARGNDAGLAFEVEQVLQKLGEAFPTSVAPPAPTTGDDGGSVTNSKAESGRTTR